MSQPLKVEVKNVKVSEFASHETLCFEAAVYVDGKKAAVASNDGQGGPNNYDVADKALWAKFQSWVRTLPPVDSEFADDDGTPVFLDMCEDLYIGELVEAFQEAKALRRHCKTKTLFLLKGENSKDGYHTVKAPFSPAVKAYLVKKYGDKLVRIVNEELE